MAQKVEHFEAGKAGFVDQINKLVDTVNELSGKVVELEKALDDKADKRKTSASK